MNMSPYLTMTSRTMVEVVRDRHLVREAAGDRSREHFECAVLLDEIDRLEEELDRKPGLLQQIAPALALAACVGAWAGAIAWWLR